jgi:hypothetical protein
MTTLSLSAIYIIAQSEPRYSIPMRPEMYILSPYFVWISSALYSFLAQVLVTNIYTKKWHFQ